eukprot:tig00021339_g20434.t1
MSDEAPSSFAADVRAAHARPQSSLTRFFGAPQKKLKPTTVAAGVTQLPDPRAPGRTPAEAKRVAAANDGVEDAIAKKQKRASYGINKIPGELKLQIAKYQIVHNSGTATARYFRVKLEALGVTLDESRARRWAAKLQTASKLENAAGPLSITVWPSAKRGRAPKLGTQLTEYVKTYIRELRDHGCVGKTDQCHKFAEGIAPEDWWIDHSPKHWSTEETMLRYEEHILAPYKKLVVDQKGLEEDQIGLLVFDNYAAQSGAKYLEACQLGGWITYQLPPNCTGELQPCDALPNATFKNGVRKRFTKWYADEVSRGISQWRKANPQSIERPPVTKVDVTLTRIKAPHLRWLVESWQDLKAKPQLIRSAWDKCLNGKGPQPESTPQPAAEAAAAAAGASSSQS